MNAVADKMLFDSATSVQASVGVNWARPNGLQITQERINQFADATGDHQWIHVDPEAGQERSVRRLRGLWISDAVSGQSVLPPAGQLSGAEDGRQLWLRRRCVFRLRCW